MPTVSGVTASPEIPGQTSPDTLITPNASVDAAPAGEAVAQGPAMLAIEVSADAKHGYQTMVNHVLRELLKNKDLHPDAYRPDDYFNPNLPADQQSDMYKLLTADKQHIGKIVHDISIKHGFFNPEKHTSIRVGEHARMHIGANGNLEFAPDQDAPFAEHAPGGAGVTAPYHPGGHAEPESSDTVPGSASSTEATPVPHIELHTPAGIQENVEVQPDPHPITFPETLYDHVNTFGYRIPMNNAHIYADPKGEVLVYGGKLEAQKDAIFKHLLSHPEHKVVYGTDVTRNYRVPFHLVPEKTVDGKVVEWKLVGGPKMRGFLGKFAKAPKPDDLVKIYE